MKGLNLLSITKLEKCKKGASRDRATKTTTSIAFRIFDLKKFSHSSNLWKFPLKRPLLPPTPTPIDRPRPNEISLVSSSREQYPGRNESPPARQRPLTAPISPKKFLPQFK